MNFKKKSFCFILVFLSLFVLTSNDIVAQNPSLVENSEVIYEHWFSALERVRQNSPTDNNDFEIFRRFSSRSLDSLRGDFLIKIGNHEVTSGNIGRYEEILTENITELYRRFQRIMKEFPSSVEEYDISERPKYLTAQCDSACNNIDFESGNLSGWNAFYAFNNSNTSTAFTNITGGPAGPVTEAANDLLTNNPLYYNATVGANPSPDYQISITSGSRGDAIVPSIPVVSPFGGHYSVMLGDSTQVNYGVAILSQTFQVSTSNANFTYQYAVFLANPPHSYYQQPFFRIFFLDQAGDTIPSCGEYTVIAGQGTQSFNRITYYDTFPNASTDTFSVFYKNWTTVNVPLKKYIGQCITVVFEVGDCSLGGHFAYAYVDASCSPLDILSSSQFFCGQDSIFLTGPAGENSYDWTGPAGGIISSNTTRNITIDDSGTYKLIITPVTGSACNDTLTIKIGEKPGPPPKPDFSADTVCLGNATSFINKSNPENGGRFYWDFYNIGSFQDSSTGPSWIYNLPGTYKVKLQENVNGCGADTIITVVVDSSINPSFNANKICPKDSVSFINTSTGANLFNWNFGDPSSGNKNASTITNPYHVYNSAGNYKVTLTAKKSGGCSDTMTESVTVFPGGTKTIIGPETICFGTSAEIDASAGNKYMWNTGATTSSVSVSPDATTSYYCGIVNSFGCKDSVYSTVIVDSAAVVNACCDENLTPGQSTELLASGTGTYMWRPSSGLNCITCSNPLASPSVTTTYTLTVMTDSGCSASKTVTIDVSCGDVFIPDIFSPDNSGINNILYVRSPCIVQMVFMVFDRWGNKVFESENQNIGWDGRHNDLSMNTGTYIWQLKATLFDGTHVEKKGNVTLLR